MTTFRKLVESHIGKKCMVNGNKVEVLSYKNDPHNKIQKLISVHDDYIEFHTLNRELEEPIIGKIFVQLSNCHITEYLELEGKKLKKVEL
jgi:hypothetical protein